MSKTRTEYALLNICANSAGYFINTILGFACRIVFVRCLTAEHLGVAGLFTNLIMMLSLSELGLGAVMTHALYEPIAKNDKAKINALMAYFAKLYRIIFIIFILIGVSLTPYLDVLIKEPPNISENLQTIYLLFLFTTAITYLFAHQNLFLIASQKQYVVMTVNYTATIIQSCLQIVFLFLTKNYIYYLIIQAFGTILQFLFISFLIRKNIHDRDINPYNLTKIDKTNTFRNIWQLSLGKFSGFLVHGTDNIIIAKLVGLVSVGLLSNYVLLIKTLESFIVSLMGSISAGIGNFNALSDKQATSKLFDKLSFMAFVIYGWISIAFFMISNDLVRLVFGESYVMPPLVSALLCLNFFMAGSIHLVGLFMNAVGIFTKGRLVVILTALLNVALSILLGLKWGIAGVLAATAIARLMTNWWYQPRILFKYGFECKPTTYFINYSFFIIIIIASLLLSSMGGAIVQIEPTPLYTSLKILIPSILYFLCIYWIYRKSEELEYTCTKINQIYRKLLSKRFL